MENMNIPAETNFRSGGVNPLDQERSNLTLCSNVTGVFAQLDSSDVRLEWGFGEMSGIDIFGK